ncbi:hypothetical protein [Imhoffiella purpurea]|uniref:Uncharacterized protein n=1 Tax=Imhoffiella purpurea TaxID=1249627 RepID=W9VAT8_9GAMM|nr:hypothetical protein [Imhoffiella purpurea]EXJ14041.1 hypothetical protein D779_3003 [Imhoffiella purpurea]
MPKTPPTTKRPGPKPSGNAMTNAERQRRYIERLKAKADNPVTNDSELARQLRDLEQAFDSQRRELLRLQNQMRNAGVETLQDEIKQLRAEIQKHEESARASAQERARLESEIQRLKGNESAYREQIARFEARGTTRVSNDITPRGYPSDIKRLAVELADEGKPTSEVRAAILAAHGKAPDISNMAKLVGQWRATLARTRNA